MKPTPGDLAELRSIGVKRIVFGHTTHEGFPVMSEVEFFSPEVAVDARPSMPKHLDLGAPALCPCSHDEISHNGHGLCLQGCEPERCQEAATQ